MASNGAIKEFAMKLTAAGAGAVAAVVAAVAAVGEAAVEAAASCRANMVGLVWLLGGFLENRRMSSWLQGERDLFK